MLFLISGICFFYIGNHQRSHKNWLVKQVSTVAVSNLVMSKLNRSLAQNKNETHQNETFIF